MAATYGNRSDYVNKAIDNFRLAMKEDPSASFLVEDIAELYRRLGTDSRGGGRSADGAESESGRFERTARAGAHLCAADRDAQANHIDEGMARRAVEQYKSSPRKIPKTWKA